MKCIVSSMKMRVRVFYVLLYLSAADPSRGLSVRSTWSLQIGTRVPVCSYMHTFVIDPPPPLTHHSLYACATQFEFCFGGGGLSRCEVEGRWGGNGAKAILAFWHIGEVSPFSIHVENRGRMREHKIIGLVPPQCMRDFEFVLLPFLVIAVKRMSVPTTLNPFCPTVVPLLQVTHFIML